MSWILSGAVKSHKMPALQTDKGDNVSDSACKFVLLMYADSANDEGYGAYPGIRALVAMTQLSTETVSNAVNALRLADYLIPDGISPRMTNNYRVNVEKLGVLVTRTRRSSEQNGGIPPTRTNPLRGGGGIGELTQIYQSEIGVITAMIADDLQADLDDYGFKWCVDAITEAVRQNKRTWKYIQGILKRWKAQGNQEPSKPGRGKTPPAPARARRRKMPSLGVEV